MEVADHEIVDSIRPTVEKSLRVSSEPIDPIIRDGVPRLYVMAVKLEKLKSFDPIHGEVGFRDVEFNVRDVLQGGRGEQINERVPRSRGIFLLNLAGVRKSSVVAGSASDLDPLVVGREFPDCPRD